MPELHIDPFYILVTLVGLVAWFTRLEAKTSRNELDIMKMESKQEVLEKTVVQELSQVKESLARIEGRLLHKDQS